MKASDQIIDLIKKTAHEYLPDAEVFLFGSRARMKQQPKVIMMFSWLPKPLYHPKQKSQYELKSGRNC